jgi:hypothetical protein
MIKLSVADIIKNIEAEKPFHAVVIDYSFELKIEEYVPYVCTAIHNGHQFRKELWDNCLHSEFDRWYEEDPETKSMIASHPIVLSGCDSRFEYDLNRSPEEAIYETAWGKQLWKKPLDQEQKRKSLAKHNAFYKVVTALVQKIEHKFGMVLVYDMHSYNWKRWDREVPTWNLGTSNIDNVRFGNDIDAWRKSLSEIHLPYNIKSTALINDTFQGNGYFLKFITKSFQNTLVLATEIAKIYCDEYEYIIFPEVVESVAFQLRLKIKEHAYNFYNKYTK